MRKTLLTLVTLALFFSVTLPVAEASTYSTAMFTIGSTTASVNGQTMTMDLAPFLDPVTGLTYIPVRYLGTALGATVAWDAANQTITLTKPGYVVVLTVGSPVMVVNGQALSMDAAPQVMPPGRTVLPASWVAEAFGFHVTWVPSLREMYVTDLPPIPAPAKPATAS